MQLGYDAPYNEDCEVRNNVIVRGDLSINKYRSVVNKDNLIIGKSDPLPTGTRVILRPNRYDSRRANLAIYNFERKPVALVDLGPVLKRGDRFRLMDPREFYGKPVLAGIYAGLPIRVPLAEAFAAFVLLKGQPD